MTKNPQIVWLVQEFEDDRLHWQRLFSSEIVARMAAIRLVHAYLMDDNAEVPFKNCGRDKWAWSSDPGGYYITLEQRKVH